MTHPQIRRAISMSGVAVGLVCMGLDIARGAPAFWPLLAILFCALWIWGVTEWRDRPERRP